MASERPFDRVLAAHRALPEGGRLVPPRRVTSASDSLPCAAEGAAWGQHGGSVGAAVRGEPRALVRDDNASGTRCAPASVSARAQCGPRDRSGRRHASRHRINESANLKAVACSARTVDAQVAAVFHPGRKSNEPRARAGAACTQGGERTAQPPRAWTGGARHTRALGNEARTSWPWRPWAPRTRVLPTKGRASHRYKRRRRPRQASSCRRGES